jgi:hypothetical protein
MPCELQQAGGHHNRFLLQVRLLHKQQHALAVLHLTAPVLVMSAAAGAHISVPL